MRLWSLHPMYLDTKGLLAVWREGLLAKTVLNGRTKGYRNHPQLVRFRESGKVLIAINTYLYYISEEASKRGYMFNISKIGKIDSNLRIPVAEGQLLYEFEHLKKKLKSRDQKKYDEIKIVAKVEPNPLFYKIIGTVEKWEKIEA